jgi:hypothetical protein
MLRCLTKPSSRLSNFIYRRKSRCAVRCSWFQADGQLAVVFSFFFFTQVFYLRILEREGVLDCSVLAFLSHCLFLFVPPDFLISRSLSFFSLALSLFVEEVFWLRYARIQHNLAYLELEQADLSTSFVEPDIREPHVFKDLLRGLRSITITDSRLSGGDWSPLTNFLTRRAAIGSRISSFSLGYCPRMDESVVESIRRAVEVFERW